uniref:ABC transmembrane type-1 domain-containing protein n=1 Tax=Aegilops tauschii subsp. strangulata TaxID=200361 RepID=A0A453G9D6_AEGTS
DKIPLPCFLILLLCIFGHVKEIIMTPLFYRYQKKASKFAQEFTASANNVAQEAISLVRTVRVYGTEKQEFKRYAKWLDKLYDVSFRQTMAYGGWSLSLNYLYHSTQLCVGCCCFDWRNSNHEWEVHC